MEGFEEGFEEEGFAEDTGVLRLRRRVLRRVLRGVLRRILVVGGFRGGF